MFQISYPYGSVAELRRFCRPLEPQRSHDINRWEFVGSGSAIVRREPERRLNLPRHHAADCDAIRAPSVKEE
jgi:hypothetical protein